MVKEAIRTVEPAERLVEVDVDFLGLEQGTEGGEAR